VPDDGWPTRPAQTTLDGYGYVSNTQGKTRQDSHNPNNAPNPSQETTPLNREDSPPIIEYA
jgi:hypothetical protein